MQTHCTLLYIGAGKSATDRRCATVLIKSSYVRRVALLMKLYIELRDVTYHIGSHSVTCHPTQVNTPRRNANQTGWYLIYLPRRDGRLSCPR